MIAKFSDPKMFGLPPQTIIEEVKPKRLAIVINRKSRIVMADAKKILTKITTIKQAKPGFKVLLKTTAPLCSKSLQFFADHGIEVIRV